MEFTCLADTASQRPPAPMSPRSSPATSRRSATKTCGPGQPALSASWNGAEGSQRKWRSVLASTACSPQASSTPAATPPSSQAWRRRSRPEGLYPRSATCGAGDLDRGDAWQAASRSAPKRPQPGRCAPELVGFSLLTAPTAASPHHQASFRAWRPSWRGRRADLVTIDAGAGRIKPLLADARS